MARPDPTQAAKFFADNAHPSTEIEKPLYFGLHIGPSGSGKTSCMGSMPKPMVLLDAEGGTIPLRKKKGITVLTINTWQDFRMALAHLEEGKHNYKSLAVDGLAKFQAYSIADILRANDKTFVTQELWGVVLQHANGVIEYLQTIGATREMHVAVTTLETTYDDKERGVPIAIMPDLKGSIRDRIAAMFDVVVYHATKELPAKEGEEHGKLLYRALTKPYGTRVLARDRWEALEIAEEPNIEHWIEKIWASVEDDSDTSSETHTEAAGEVEGHSEDDSLPEGEIEAEDAQEEPETEPEPAPEPAVETPAKKRAAAKKKAPAKKTKPEAEHLPPAADLITHVKEWFEQAVHIVGAGREKEIKSILTEEAEKLGYPTPKAMLEDDNSAALRDLIVAIQDREQEFVPKAEEQEVF